MRHKINKIILLTAIFVITTAISTNINFSGAADSASVSITATVNLAPPENADATNTSDGVVDISWDKSPSQDFGQVESYEVYVKAKSVANYPATTTYSLFADGSGSYNLEISGLVPNVGYDFIVYALTNNLFKSPFDCASCKTTNSVCGNITVEPGEQCDGTDLNGETCTTLGYTTNKTLTCTTNCTFDYPSCSSSGGGTTTIIQTDSTNPTPGTATSPVYANKSPILVSYSGAYDTGGSGLSRVELLYKENTGNWKNSGLTSSGGSGSYNFTTLGTTSGTYYFDLIAYDNQGNFSSYPTGNGDTSTIYDIVVPTVKTLTVAPKTSANPIVVSYTDALDTGGSNLKEIDLWYKKGLTGTWTSSGLKSTTKDGSFNFSLITGNDTYYFDVVLSDNAGNLSSNPTGNGKASTIYSSTEPTVILNNLPEVNTFSTSANIIASGTDVVSYKYKLNYGIYSEETDISKNIVLSGLKEGINTINAIGKNSLGVWQKEVNSTSYSWFISLNSPILTISSPSSPVTFGNSISYTIDYLNADTITLKNEDVILNKFGNVNGDVAVTTIDEDSRLITISNITGNGSMSISIAFNTAQNENGKFAPSAGPGNVFTINVTTTYCGDSIIAWGSEECDDGNKINGDGCTSNCKIEDTDHCFNFIKDLDEEEIDCGGEDCPACHKAPIDHCTNLIQDEDEEGLDCGGATCEPCELDKINFSLSAKPEGRSNKNYTFGSDINFKNIKTSGISKKSGVNLSREGLGSFEMIGLEYGNYDIGIKGDAYLQFILKNIPVLNNKETINLDFTLNNIKFLLGGDVWPDNMVNSSDIANTIKNYMKANNIIDMNKDGYVNSADIALVIRNYYKKGENF